MRLLTSMGLFLFTAWLFTSAVANAETIVGRVVGVHDGDTIAILDAEKHQTKIRLAEIDAPELKQPYGNKSKQMLSGLVFDKDVMVTIKAIDKYGRTVGRVYQGDIDVNLSMVKQGGAWAYRQYLTDDAILAAEDTARASGAGLWGLQDDQRMPPWEWRHGKKQAQNASSVVCTMDAKECPDGSYVSRTGPNCEFAPCSKDVGERPGEDKGTFTCAGKTVCKQMASCAEAMFYLTRCGVTRLDGDHDGIPCESICR